VDRITDVQAKDSEETPRGFLGPCRSVALVRILGSARHRQLKNSSDINPVLSIAILLGDSAERLIS
jgi:hypothetical protein